MVLVLEPEALRDPWFNNRVSTATLNLVRRPIPELSKTLCTVPCEVEEVAASPSANELGVEDGLEDDTDVEAD